MTLSAGLITLTNLHRMAVMMNSLSRQQQNELVNATDEPSTADNLDALVADHDQQLAQLGDLLAAMASSQYLKRDPPNDSVGAHVRHVIEHYDCLVNHRDGLIDYDYRPRDPELENSLETALDRIGRLRATLPQLVDKPVRIRHQPGSGPEEPTLYIDSSIERELLFLVSHTIHHMAMIGLFARRAGLQVPSSFGVTPSTLRFRIKSASAVAEAS